MGLLGEHIDTSSCEETICTPLIHQTRGDAVRTDATKCSNCIEAQTVRWISKPAPNRPSNLVLYRDAPEHFFKSSFTVSVLAALSHFCRGSSWSIRDAILKFIFVIHN